MVVVQTLHGVLDPISPEPSPSELLTAFDTSCAVRNLLKGDHGGFYAVVVGAPSGIHRTRYVPVLLLEK